MSILEIIALVTSLVFLSLELVHSKWLWPMQIISCTALLLVYVPDRLWGLSAIQAYYIVMSVIGIFSWKKDAARSEDEAMPLNRPNLRTLIESGVIFFIGSILCSFILTKSGDPSPFLDSIVTVLSIIGTWWLTRSYSEQWLIWIVADAISAALCLHQGLYGLMALYSIYSIASVVGYFNWTKKGTYR